MKDLQPQVKGCIHMAENKTQENDQSILSSGHLRRYTLFSAVLVSIVGLYYVFSMNLFTILRQTPFSPGIGRPGQGPAGMPNALGQMYNIWPLWGTLVIPSLEGIFIASGAILLLIGFILILRHYEYRLPSLPILVVTGLVLLVLTNLIHGWSVGIESTIGAMSEIYSDISKVVNPISFVSNFNTFQASLSLHAQTQPPGAVLTIYFLNLIFQEPAYIAIGLSIISGVFSAFFINGLYKKLFDSENAKYGAFLYLLLPAIQVYYLANIYAIVATLAAGALSFYFNSNRILKYVGTFVTIFLGTFISFLFVYIPLVILLFEVIRSLQLSRDHEWSKRFVDVISSVSGIIIIGIGIVLVYLLMYLGLGFNYVEAFLYASSLENPGGFMLLSNPAEYIITRLDDILDIVVFFGPFLAVFAYEGIRSMRKSLSDEKTVVSYSLAMSSIISLLLLFLTGAPKKGETARICMFALPLFLIPILYYLMTNNFRRKEKMKLLLLVFGQAVIMQLFATYIW